jgi:plastocyanin
MWGSATAMCGALVLGGAGVSGASMHASAAKTGSVSIANYLFAPATLKVKVNTKVTWTNNDTTGHNVVGTTFGHTKAIPFGKTFSYKFTTAGTYVYHCTIHSGMTGKIVVAAK